MTLKLASVFDRGDYVPIDRDVAISQNNTTLRIAARSVGRFVREAYTPDDVIILLGTWHIRIPRAAVSRLRPSNSPLPFPWVGRFLTDAQPRSLRGRQAMIIPPLSEHARRRSQQRGVNEDDIALGIESGIRVHGAGVTLYFMGRFEIAGLVRGMRWTPRRYERREV